MSLTQIIEKISSDLYLSVSQPSENPNIKLTPEPPAVSTPKLQEGLLSHAPSLVEIPPQSLLRGLVHRASFFSTPEMSEAEPLQSYCTVTGLPGSLSFGSVKKNQSGYQNFTIRNPNCCSVNFSMSGAPYVFTVSPSSGSIPANGSVLVTVTFRPTNKQYYTGSFNINFTTASGSVSPSSHSVSLSGNGTD